MVWPFGMTTVPLPPFQSANSVASVLVSVYCTTTFCVAGRSSCAIAIARGAPRSPSYTLDDATSTIGFGPLVGGASMTAYVFPT